LSEGLRLNRFLALAGVASRRAADKLVVEGRVAINGSICRQPGTRVAEGDHVKMDGRRVEARHCVTILLHKPRGFVCTKSDELGRATIYSLLPASLRHLNHVGRLDLDSEGLLVLTNDGALARRLTHPSQGIEKEYRVTVDRAVEDATLGHLTTGVHTPVGTLVAKEVRRMSARRVMVVLDHGAKRQIREMFAALGFRVTKLLRIRIGALGDDLLPPGAWRHLDSAETAALLTNPQNLRKESRRRRSRDL